MITSNYMTISNISLFFNNNNKKTIRVLTPTFKVAVVTTNTLSPKKDQKKKNRKEVQCTLFPISHGNSDNSLRLKPTGGREEVKLVM